MNTITGDTLLDLMFEDISSDKVIEVLDTLGLEQPVLDEQYEIDLDVRILDEKHDLGFVFKEIEGYTQNGEPCLIKLSFEKETTISYPFSIEADDGYEDVARKIGKKADFKSDFFLDLRTWIMQSDKGLKYEVNIFFKDEENLRGIEVITIMYFTSVSEDFIRVED